MNNVLVETDLELIEVLESRSLPIYCDEGRKLFAQGEACNGLYILESGEAALMLNAPSGRAVFCLKVGSGSLLGLPAVVGREPYSMTAIVKKGATVKFVTRYDFEKLIEAEPQLYPGVLRLLAAEVRSARLALTES
ncbi:MAG: Crp/Fnr family transcriptional regulator [Terracidiphilus sp.]